MLAPFRLCFFFFFCPPIWRAALRAALAITPLTSTLNNIPFALEKQKRSLVSVIFPCEGKSEKEKRSSQMEIKICDGKAKGSDEKIKLEKTTAAQAAKCSKSIYKALSRCDPLPRCHSPFATHATLNSEPRPLSTARPTRSLVYFRPWRSLL